jgi:catechol 2,3-dioxygenase-like lactoylglutathione lyase family enzyme
MYAISDMGMKLQVTSTEERVKTMGLFHLALNVTDLDRSVKFYTDLFRIDVLRQEEDMAILHTPGTSDSFVLFRANGPVAPSGIAHFGFKVDDNNFDKAMNYVQKHGITVISSPIRATGRFLYIEDPDGYVVQISTI